ncbi:MAG TPA: Clp1/GlmU family protein [Candidatus Tripitaka sp. YC43]
MTDIRVLPGLYQNGTGPGWKELVDSIDRLKGVVIILGAPDTGKTTLAFYLSRELQLRGCNVAMVSADMGQCAFGPPATLGMSALKGPTSLKDLKVHSMYFIGSTSPVGHLLQTTVGLKKLVEKAQGGGAEVVIIDTSGLIEGGAAWELKFQEIELVNARHVVALQRGQELEGILSPHEDRKCRTIHRLKIYEGIKPKSYERRRDYRRQKFSEYFQKATTKGIPLVAVRLINPLNILTGEGCGGQYKRLLVGLNDDENFTLGLGIIEDMGLKELRLLTPIEGIERVKLVRLGDIRLDENWYDSRVKQG